jgi:hypothetical protein
MLLVALGCDSTLENQSVLLALIAEGGSGASSDPTLGVVRAWIAVGSEFNCHPNSGTSDRVLRSHDVSQRGVLVGRAGAGRRERRPGHRRRTSGTAGWSVGMSADPRSAARGHF